MSDILSGKLETFIKSVCANYPDNEELLKLQVMKVEGNVF